MGQKRKLDPMGKETLKDPMVEPNDNILENALGYMYPLYTEFVKKIVNQDLMPEWNYYNDTKSWLCRILYNNKNYCWLSILDSGIKLTLYFSKETINNIYEMDINDNIKKMAKENEIGRKNPPVIILIQNKSILEDAINILKYRINLG
jgi:hypothetical protein